MIIIKIMDKKRIRKGLEYGFKDTIKITPHVRLSQLQLEV